MKSRIGLTLFLSLLIGASVAMAAPVERRARGIEAAGTQIAFQTLDGGVQDVSAEEIWRVRGATTSEEPVGSVVIDYGFERVYVKESLESVVSKIREQHDLRRFTLPDGAPIYIAPDKIIGINRPIPQQHHQNSQSVIIAREGQQQVRESRQAIADTLKQ